MSGAKDDDHGPGEKAILGVVAAVGGGILLWAIQHGDSTAFFIFLMLLSWIIARYTRWWNPWGAAAAVAVGWFLYGIFH
jgi:hypothetical protein